MTKQILNKCCGCATLRTGTLIIGTLLLIVWVTTFFYYCLATNNAGSDIQINSGDRISTAIASGIGIIAVIFLLIGSIKRKPVLLLPWLIVFLLVMLVLVISAILLALQSFNKEGAAKDGIFSVFRAVAWILLSIYCWLVVHSYYAELKNEVGISRPFA